VCFFTPAMPLLKREPDVFPVDLFDSPGGAPWIVAHVRSRQEKVLARFLSPVGVAFYAPQREKRARRNGRNFVSYLPLFPGYVFLRAEPEDRARVWRSGVVVRMIDVPDQALLETELAQIHRLQLAGARFAPARPLEAGEPVRVVDGPFEGYLGIVVRDGGASRLLVSVSLLRKTVAVEFEREMVAPISLHAALPPVAAPAF
jgi:transcription antitermination factor NusG